MNNIICTILYVTASHTAHIIEATNVVAGYSPLIAAAIIFFLVLSLGFVVYCIINNDKCRERTKSCCDLLVLPCYSCKYQRRETRRRWSGTIRYISPPSTAHIRFPEPTEDDIEQLDFVSTCMYVCVQESIQ